MVSLALTGPPLVMIQTRMNCWMRAKDRQINGSADGAAEQGQGNIKEILK